VGAQGAAHAAKRLSSRIGITSVLIVFLCLLGDELHNSANWLNHGYYSINQREGKAFAGGKFAQKPGVWAHKRRNIRSFQ
jgi:hypothetical protein